MKWYFDNFVYDSIDGVVTTFTIVAYVVGYRLNFLISQDVTYV